MKTQPRKPGKKISDKNLGIIITVIGPIIVAIITVFGPSLFRTPAPTLTPTAILTSAASAAFTPSPSPSFTPPVTITNTPSPSPTTTATPGPLASITSLKNGDSITEFVDLLGGYSAEAADKPVWIFVQEQVGTYWIQSMDPCKGSGTSKVNGKWEIFMGVGVASSEGPFDIVLTVADEAANNYLAETLINQCKTNKYTGLPALPSGVSEIQRIKVYRHKVVNPADAYGPAPELPNAGLPGLISLIYPAAGVKVSPVETVSGTVSGANDKVWVLVHTFYGKWFPQSNVPCIGDDTHFDASGGWSVKTILGGDQDKGKPFDVVVVLANEQANQILDAKQKADCLANNYTGFFTIELPAGISEKYSMRFIRK
ncbi:MAG: hypothetical protein P4L50_10705 [Anaerolineaceae bacterium]|nr:hypothetical protein [Anaerolineaceae bacterium]